MKKMMFLVLIVALFVGVPSGYSLFEKNTGDNSKQGKNMPPTGMKREGVGSTAARPAISMDLMQNMMVMQAMKERSIVATSEGGMVVIIGNQMVKYDKDLNVVKEAELKIDLDKLRQNMMKMIPNSITAKEDR